MESLVLRILKHPVMWLAVLTLGLYSPSLFFGKLFFNFDTLTQDYGYIQHFEEYPHAWREAAYSNAFYGGANVVNNPGINLFGFLITLKPAFISGITFHHAVTAGFFFLFLLASYVFFLDHGFDRWLAFALTLAVGCSARYLYASLTPLWVASFFLFPAVCVMFLRWQRTYEWRYVLFGGMALALALLFGYSGLFILVSIPASTYALFLGVNAWRHSQANGRRFFLGLIGMLAIGLVASAWYLLPVYRFAQLTVRGSGLPYSQAQEEVLHLLDIPRLLLPWWEIFASSESLLYVGSFGLLCLIATVYHRSLCREETFWRWVLLGTLFFSVHYSPLPWFFNKLPLFSSLRTPSRMLFVAIFAACVLIGIRIEAWYKEKSFYTKTRTARVLKVGYILFGGSVLIGSGVYALGGMQALSSLLFHVFDTTYYSPRMNLPLEHYHRVISSMLEAVGSTVSLKSLSTWSMLMSALVAVLVLAERMQKKPSIIIGGLVIPAILLGFGRLWSLQTVSASVIMRTPDSARYILQQPDHDLYRVFTLFFGTSKFLLLDTPSDGRATLEDQVSYARDLLAVNLHSRYGVQSIDGYDAFQTRRTNELNKAVFSESVYGDRPALSKLSMAEKLQLFSSRLNILSMMNVKYLLTAFPLNDHRLKLVWTGETTHQHIPLHLYENTEVLPRVYLAKHLTCIPESESGALAEVLKNGINFHEETVVESDLCSKNAQVTSSTDTLKLVHYEEGMVRMQTNTSEERLVVLSENNSIPGWRATLDGRDIARTRVNSIYQGVWVPKGEHQVEFVYDGK